MNENVESKRDHVTKWLRVLLYIDLAGLINSVISYIPIVPNPVTTLISRGVMLGVILCLFQLWSIDVSYRKAAIYRVIVLVCIFLFLNVVIVLAGSVFSLMAVYQEYAGHALLIEQKDPKLSGKWRSLFLWGILAGFLAALGSSVATLLVTMTDMDTVMTQSIISAITSAPEWIIDIVYLLYLKKTIEILDGEVPSHDDSMV